MNDVQIALLAARTLIADPEDWTQRWYARTEDKELVHGWDDRAVCWCALGALEFLSIGSAISQVARRRLNQATSPNLVEDFNDAHTHAEVIAAFDRAIELAA